MPEKRTPETRLPPWIKAKMPGGPKYMELKELMRKKNLHTVCEEAHCPNIGECWERGTATFMILGEICTRACRYCAVTTGKPNELDTFEPIRVAESVKSMNLSYCVITAVNRDDLSDGGAAIFADCIKRIRETSPHCKVEVLIPDLQGNWDALTLLLDQKPDVLNHNIESTREIFPLVRAKGDYDLSLELLAQSKAIDPSIVTKSGIIVGMGESTQQLKSTMQDLREVDCDLLTIGQYLRPSQKHLKTVKYYKPDEFEDLKQVGLNLGFKHVASGPLVRSSYHADEQHMSATTV
ncbi:MAG: lipoyl synthase [SAR202 cluster bacterium]|nr:lipoyl synthase [SAR202 cluster bacterium]|tara:strand:- start:1542 stop:2423 length:882 start_codon:yes stop_codon:yes gene_type:complete